MFLMTMVIVSAIPVSAIETSALLFQEDNVPSAVSAAYKFLSPAYPGQQLRNLTVCLRFNVRAFRENTYVFSYSTKPDRTNELNLGLSHNLLFMAYASSYLRSSRRPFSILPGDWHHFCFRVQQANGKLKAAFFMNGVLDSETELHDSRILELNGSLVLGQETDEVNGGFQDHQSFSGYIRDFNIWSRALSYEEVADVSDCSNVSHGDIVDWQDTITGWTLTGGVKVVNISIDCEKRSEQAYHLHLEMMSMEEAKSFCNKLQSGLVIPRYEKENELLYNTAYEYNSHCNANSYATAFVWIGATDILEESVWTDFKGVPLNYSRFRSSRSSTKTNCAAFAGFPYLNKWEDVRCSGLNTRLCALCSSRDNLPAGVCHEDTPPIDCNDGYTSSNGREEGIVFRMRGLCDADKKARVFVMTSDLNPTTLRYSFRGLTKFFLSLSEDLVWYLVDEWQNITVASLYLPGKEYPFGTFSWVVRSSTGLCGTPLDQKKQLTFSSCRDDQFPCSEGSCVPHHRRCDRRKNCPDASDEDDCQKLLTEEGYMASLPPPGGNFDEPLEINLTVAMNAVTEIDIVNMRLIVDFSASMMWLEPRVFYRNLKNHSNLNYINESQVWVPEFTMVNSYFPEVYKKPATLTCVKHAAPMTDDSSKPIYDEIYDGASNPLKFEQEANGVFYCDMNLVHFPFDIQSCQLQFLLKSARSDFARWHTVRVRYLGDPVLSEYEITKLETNISVTDSRHSLSTVSITLYGRFWYYIGSSYVPTLSLMIIGYASLFCDKDNSDLRVMMALTTLLVLHSLYQQTSQALPKTTYIKSIDIWSFFAMTFIFCQVIFHVVVDLDFWIPCIIRKKNTVQQTKYGTQSLPGNGKRLRLEAVTAKGEREENKRPPLEQNWWRREDDGRGKEKEKMLRAGQIFFAITGISFIFFYWITLLKIRNVI